MGNLGRAGYGSSSEGMVRISIRLDWKKFLAVAVHIRLMRCQYRYQPDQGWDTRCLPLSKR